MTAQSSTGNSPHSFDYTPEELTVAEFTSVHGAYMDIASSTELSPQDRTTLAEDLNRLCVTNPTAYAEFQEQQRTKREAGETLLSQVAMQEVYFHGGDIIGTVG